MILDGKTFNWKVICCNAELRRLVQKYFKVDVSKKCGCKN